MRGRKNKQESRAAEIRARLAVWRQPPEAQRISLRALAVELGTSHQLLSFYLRGLDKWQSREYQCKSKAIRDRAEAEERPLTPIEQGQVAAFDRAHDCAFADYIASDIIHGCLVEVKRGTKLPVVMLSALSDLARKGYPGARGVVVLHERRSFEKQSKKIKK